ncbi:MAG: phospholipase [Gammaproteobacteria bacterium]|nr:MAG: phospholipase [Gammaproteobacteria bacterium]
MWQLLNRQYGKKIYGTKSQGKTVLLLSMLAVTSVANATQEGDVKPNLDLFLACAQVNKDSARLACYDKVSANAGLPNFVAQKAAIDLGKTFRSTIKGNPELVLEGEIPAYMVEDVAKESIKSHTAKQQLDNNKNLDNQILSRFGVTQNDVEKYSPLSLAYDLDKNSEIGNFKLRAHNPMYVLPVFVHDKPNRTPNSPNHPSPKPMGDTYRSPEAKYQLSVKTKVAEDLFDTNADLWFGYTQQSHWQVYNEDNSHPFRANDYMPEIFVTQPVTAELPFNGRLRMLGAGLMHHSNGEDDPISRSWNKMYLMAGAEWGDLTVIPRFSKRIENEKNENDDNPDIEDFYGFGDVQVFYPLDDKNNLAGMFRISPSTGKGAVQVDYTHELDNGVGIYLQLFHGYGESIIDYNYEDTTVGVGVMLNDWQGL